MSSRDPLTDVESDWVRPHWLHRQLDPPTPGASTTGGDDVTGNVTQRNWTVVGNLDSERQATVDPRGLVTPWPGGWSLDWWIGADDRWHVPAREVAVRQRLVDAAPVVETMVRIPGGDAVQRVWALRRSSLDGGGELVVVEVENASKVPVALALAVRPYNAEGLARVGRVDLLDGTVVTVDGEVALLLPKAPARVAASTLAVGDSAQVVLSGDAPESWTGPVDCPAGRAQAALVYPLAHGAALRVVLPLDPPPARRRRGGRGSTASFPEVVPPAAHVAKGWVAQSRRGLRLELPDPRLAEAVEANRRFLLLSCYRTVAEVTARERRGRRRGAPVAAAVVAALDRFGYDEEATGLASPRGRRRAVGRDALGAADLPSHQGAAAADHPAVPASASPDHGPAGLSPVQTLRLALAELVAGDRRCLDRLGWVLDVATPTWTWPELVHPETSGGMAGDGHDVAAVATLLLLVRSMLVREDGDGLALASVVPEGWLGQGWEVHDAPTDRGRLSYAVRWHGPRPALLWELDRRPGRGAAVRLSAPGLDPTWSSTEPRGEALLAPVAGVAGARP